MQSDFQLFLAFGCYMSLQGLCRNFYNLCNKNSQQLNLLEISMLNLKLEKVRLRHLNTTHQKLDKASKKLFAYSWKYIG
jgi:hypothetical protein